MGIAEIEKMTMDQRLEAMELLWDSISHSPEDIPSPPWHEDVLKTRKKRMASGDAEYISIEELRKRFR
jgi:hypothetical protein